MRLQDVFNSRAVAVRYTSDTTVNDAFLGPNFFPDRKKNGIDLKWIRIHKGLGVALRPSALDAMPTVRGRKGIKVTQEEMPFFRESRQIKEKDLSDIDRARESNDPYVEEALQSIFDDTDELMTSAEIAAELMRMQLLCPENGELGIKVSMEDNTAYTYDYDSEGEWKANHYLELSGTSTWDNKDTAAPLDDLDTAVTYLRSIGVIPAYILSNSTTFRLLRSAEQIKDSIATWNGQTVNFVNNSMVESVIEQNFNIRHIAYDKMYLDSANKEQKFFLDDYVTIIGSGQLGNTWRGTTPEERTLNADPRVDVSVLSNGVAIAVKTDYGPPALTTTTASQICLPSFEGMDSIYVIKVK